MAVHIEPALDPYQKYSEFAQLHYTTDGDSLLLVPFTLKQTWLNGKPIDLVAAYFFSSDRTQYSVVKCEADSLAYWDNSFPDINEALACWLANHQSPLFSLNQPLPLESVAVSKPWGQEIWYTGVEQRGVACFGSKYSKVPIPYLLAAMPSIRGKAASKPLILLKILDPLPEEVFGDLYFELHEEKQEIYIVTHIDNKAWPDGVGRMRLGFNTKVISQAADENEFRQQFLQRVQAYRKIRREIDSLLEEKRVESDFSLNEEISVDLTKRWLAEIPASLASEEKQLREEMESYYGSLPMQVGDVVKVPLNVPHSLQHGVRTIEFQTPVYERMILAFGQKVLTQPEWDTEPGVEVMEVVPPARTQPPVLSETEGLRVEQIVDFSDFLVQRITLSPSTPFLFKAQAYQLLIVLQGALMVGGKRVEKEEAVLLPSSVIDCQIEPIGEEKVSFLVARPQEEN